MLDGWTILLIDQRRARVIVRSPANLFGQLPLALVARAIFGG